VKVIIGSYRADPRMLMRALASIETHLLGEWTPVIVDDSGSEGFRAWCDSNIYRGCVVPVADDRAGYNMAMKKVCEVAGEERFIFWEEDFVLTQTVLVHAEMEAALDEMPRLAQVALQRPAVYPIEREHGGMLEGLEARLPGSILYRRADLIFQTGTFTCNPSMWQGGVAAKGWPDGKWSEDRKRDELLLEGYTFGFLTGVRVTHDGRRRGFGY
jgi:hypothetical protein